jgi:hypothetical protein
MSEDTSGAAYPHYKIIAGGKQEQIMGLTKREYFAAMALQGIIAAKETFDPMNGQTQSEAWAELAVKRADALINALKEQPE